jgi:hypothetical protein
MIGGDVPGNGGAGGSEHVAAAIGSAVLEVLADYGIPLTWHRFVRTGAELPGNVTELDVRRSRWQRTPNTYLARSASADAVGTLAAIIGTRQGHGGRGEAPGPVAIVGDGGHADPALIEETRQRFPGSSDYPRGDVSRGDDGRADDGG